MSFARLTRDAHKSENGGRHSRKNGGWPRIMNWSAVENGLTTILEIEATIIVLLLDASQRGGRGRYHRGHWTSLFRFHEIFRVMSISQDFLPIIFGCTLHICKIITELVLFLTLNNNVSKMKKKLSRLLDPRSNQRRLRWIFVDVEFFSSSLRSGPAKKPAERIHH